MYFIVHAAFVRIKLMMMMITSVSCIIHTGQQQQQKQQQHFRIRDADDECCDVDQVVKRHTDAVLYLPVGSLSCSLKLAAFW